MSERQQDSEQTQLFVIRLWSESFDQGQRAWRGEVVDAGTDARRYFARWEDLLAFLCKAAGVTLRGSVADQITTGPRGSECDRGRQKGHA